ncbi:MAG TPA: hypothetical protein VE978_25720 [Chitinophagales bacterium]|nr:hypothetical protein [Chitinophagales bacterium]
MKVLPFENYKLISPLSEDEVIKRLAQIIEPKETFNHFFWTKNSSKPYEGKLKDGYFKIRRIIDYRNSFLPMIMGHVSQTQAYTEIRIRMRPAKAVIIFMIFWMGVVLSVCIVVLLALIAQYRQVLKEGFSFGALIPFIMVVFGCLLFTIPFKYESKKSKQYFKTLLEASEE